jgi:hypothetical protein
VATEECPEEGPPTPFVAADVLYASLKQELEAMGGASLEAVERFIEEKGGEIIRLLLCAHDAQRAARDATADRRPSLENG